MRKVSQSKSSYHIYAELSSEALGGRVLSFSDEFFSPANDLLKVPPAISRKGTFGPNGALFDGWETRRHNPDHDWYVPEKSEPSTYLPYHDR